MQLPTTKFRDGHIGMRDFRGDVVRAYTGNDAAELYAAMRRVRARAAAAAMNGDIDRAVGLTDAADRIEADLQANPGEVGWIFHSEVCIWKDPVVAQQRTKSIRLLHKQLCKDSALSGQGLADYIVTFRKPGDNPDPVAGPLAQWVGEDAAGGGVDVSPEAYEADVAERRARGQDAWPFETWRSILVWQRYASPVWTDIRQTRTLQYRGGRDEKDEQHISPLQLDVIERCVDLWSNPGETVFTPFAGIGSEIHAAVEMGRRGLGFELKDTYFAKAVKNLNELDARLDEMEALLS
ncbi:site-specific DNA-methyltransferase (plasmid) [Azospirillum argentinense]|uniref:Methyltransferase n=2 Tax=Azospirillum TaxID=191 RepID=A0A4D8Q9W0_AZOBR|nr:site-specific DNA-methyltransferase [Azospirillum argentinense]